MLKKTAIASLALGLLLFIGVSSFAPPPQADNCGCPPGWELIDDLKTTNPNVLKWDHNLDGALCFKLLGEKGDETPKGNNQGTWGPRNYKDNNQPCDEKDIIEKIKKKK